MAAIFISRFLLNLRYINLHPNGTTSQSVPPTSLRFAHWHVQSAVVNDFGDHTCHQSASRDIRLKVTGRSGDTDHADDDDEASHNVESGSIPDGFGVLQASTNNIECEEGMSVYV